VGEANARAGKLRPADLAAGIYPFCGVRRADVLLRAGIGQDAAAVAFGDEVAVLSTDPITGSGARAGWLAVHVGCNDVATAAATPVAVLIALLLAPGSARADATEIMRDANAAATELGIEIIGGHSEVTAGLPRSIVVATAVGRAPRSAYRTSAGARPGDRLYLTKAAGLEGTAILARDYGAALTERVGAEAVRRAQEFLSEISVVPEALVAAAAGATAMHDVTEGGVLGALAELAEASGCGVTVDLDAVPIRPETAAITSAFGIDPLALVSSGALLIAAPASARPADTLRAAGRTVTDLGQVVEGASELRRGGRRLPLRAPERDALWDAIEGGLKA
jgi:hydrogenase expression/formation protein HypE